MLFAMIVPEQLLGLGPRRHPSDADPGPRLLVRLIKRSFKVKTTV
jgi:hypothetical protein